MNIARLQNGDLYFNEWSLTVPLNIWTQIARGEIGRPAVSELLNISFYKAERIIAAIRSDDHPSTPSVDISGVTASDYVPDFDSVYERAVQNFQRKDDHERRRHDQRIVFHGGAIAIAHIGDTHFGGSGTDVERAFREARIIRDTPGMFAAFNGDLVDNFIIGRLANLNINTDTKIVDQWALGRAWVETLADSLIVVNGGNHDKWTLKVAGVDPLQGLAHPAALYDRDEVCLDFIVEDVVIPTIYRHQFKGYSYWNPFHSHTRAAKHEHPGYRMYVGAHTHTHGGASIIPHAGQLIHAVQCGTYKRHDEFAREKGFSETGPSTAVVTVIHPEGWIHHFTDLDAAAFMMTNVYRQEIGQLSD